jgi:hypothetical protein
MSSNPGNLSSPQPLLNSALITDGNGATLPVTHHASPTIATAQSPLHLNNVLVFPSLVKNLILVRTLTQDNNVSVEFNPFIFFSIKDLHTHTVLLQCNSTSELYPLATLSPEALVATMPTVELCGINGWAIWGITHFGRHYQVSSSPPVSSPLLVKPVSSASVFAWRFLRLVQLAICSIPNCER